MAAAVLRRWLMSGVCLLALAACTGSRHGANVNLAVVDWPPYEYFYLANRKQYDRQLRFKLGIKKFGSLRDQRQSYIRGETDAIAATLPDLIAICRESPSRCPVIVLVLDESHGADQLIASSRLAGLAGLRGRRIGLERSDLSQFILERALSEAKVAQSDVQLQFGVPSELVAQLQSGDLDALITYVPFSEPLLRDPRFNVLFSSQALPFQIVDVLAVEPELMEERPDVVRAMVASWWQARQFAQREPDAALALMASRQGITPDQLRESLRMIRLPRQNQQADLLSPAGPVEATLKRLRRQLITAGRLQQDALLPRLQLPAER